MVAPPLQADAISEGLVCKKTVTHLVIAWRASAPWRQPDGILGIGECCGASYCDSCSTDSSCGKYPWLQGLKQLSEGDGPQHSRTMACSNRAVSSIASTRHHVTGAFAAGQGTQITLKPPYSSSTHAI